MSRRRRHGEGYYENDEEDKGKLLKVCVSGGKCWVLQDTDEKYHTRM